MLIRSLQEEAGKSGFTCGVSALDRYLATNAWSNERAGISRCYVLVDPAKPQCVVGYYTLSARALEPELLKAVLKARLPRYPIPVLYVGMFGVSSAAQRRGYGLTMMRDALNRCVAAAEHVGATGVYLDSLDDKSTAFYKTLGFSALGGEALPQPMFLPMSTLRQATP